MQTVSNPARRLDYTQKSQVGKAEGKTPLGRPRRRWEDNIRINLRDMGWVGKDWMHLA